LTSNTNQTEFFECCQAVKNVYIPIADCITWASHNVPFVRAMGVIALRGVTGADGQHEAMRLGMLAVRNAVDPANNAVAALGARADEQLNLEDLEKRLLAVAEKMMDDKLARVLPEMETRLMVQISNEIMEKMSTDMEKLSNEMREMDKNATNNIQDGVTTLSNNVMNLINNKFEEMMQAQQSQNAAYMQLSNIPGPIMQVANAMAAPSSMPAAGTASGTAPGTASGTAPGTASETASGTASATAFMLRKKKVARVLLHEHIQSYRHVLPIIEKHLRQKKSMMLDALARGICDEFNIYVNINDLRDKMSGTTTMFAIADIMKTFNMNHAEIRGMFHAWNIQYRKRKWNKYLPHNPVTNRFDKLL